MNRTKAKENGMATAKWLKDEGASPEAIFIFLEVVLNHSMTWQDTRTGHGRISEVHDKLKYFADKERD